MHEHLASSPMVWPVYQGLSNSSITGPQGPSELNERLLYISHGMWKLRFISFKIPLMSVTDNNRIKRAKENL